MLKASVCSKLTKKKKPNSFGLPPLVSCPGSTSLCREKCYAKRCMVQYPNVSKILEENFIDVIRRPEQKVVHLLKLLVWGTREFRIHWSGDFFSTRYTSIWRRVISDSPRVRFWAYTRSFEYVPILEGLSNLTLYLSLDRENWREGLRCWREAPWTRLSTMGLEHESRLLGEILHTLGEAAGRRNLKVFNCPAVRGPLHGKVGACLDCRVCVDSRSRNVVNFPIHR